MAGTAAGGIKARERNLANNPNHYREIGAKGGHKSRTGGFASKKIGADGLTGRQRASVVGVIGGRIGGKVSSKRKGVEWNQDQNSASLRSTTKDRPSEKVACASCGKPSSRRELDEYGLCAYCPVRSESGKTADELAAELIAESRELDRRRS